MLVNLRFSLLVPVAGVLVSFLGFGLLLGPIVGAILAVPTAVLVGVLLDELTEKRPFLGDEGGGEKRRGSSDDSGDED